MLSVVQCSLPAAVVAAPTQAQLLEPDQTVAVALDLQAWPVVQRTERRQQVAVAVAVDTDLAATRVALVAPELCCCHSTRHAR